MSQDKEPHVVYPEDNPPSKMERRLARMDKPWVYDKDIVKLVYEKPKPGEDTISKLGMCELCEMQSNMTYIDRGRRKYCGDCAGRLMSVGKVEEKEPEIVMEPPPPTKLNPVSHEHKYQPGNPIPVQSVPEPTDLNMTLNIGGKIYDLVRRNEFCEHKKMKLIDGLSGEKSGYCKDCGQKMRRVNKGKPKRGNKKDAKPNKQ